MFMYHMKMYMYNNLDQKQQPRPQDYIIHEDVENNNTMVDKLLLQKTYSFVKNVDEEHQKQKEFL
jgi:hypothetical protein